jgi:hypothetical protein
MATFSDLPLSRTATLLPPVLVLTHHIRKSVGAPYAISPPASLPCRTQLP